MSGCSERCPFEGATCEGLESHGILVEQLIHFHYTGTSHTWNKQTNELLKFDGTPFLMPSESRLLSRASWAGVEEPVEIGVEQEDDIGKAIKAYMGERAKEGKSASFSFRIMKFINGKRVK